MANRTFSEEVAELVSNRSTLMAKDRQFDLEDPNGGARLTCWLRDDPRLRVGVRVTLKETGDMCWRVTNRYNTVVEDSEINRHWRVGGIQ